jgi:hypothetical protein
MTVRVFFKVPVFGTTSMDVSETVSAIDAFTGGAAVTTVGARMVTLTRASDATAHKVAADNIAGYEDEAVVSDKP